MKVKILIECETAGELTTHLYKLIKDIKQASKRDPDFEFPKKVIFYDASCYGHHEAVIRPEKN